jgi:hypothetical protein
MSIEVGDKLKSLDPREERIVRVIEVHDGSTQHPAGRLRVENVQTERRTFLSYPLRGRWVILPRRKGSP